MAARPPAFASRRRALARGASLGWAWACASAWPRALARPAAPQAPPAGKRSARVDTLASFGPKQDTDSPTSPLVLGTDGNYYGTTLRAFLGEGDGSVYRMTPDGHLKILHRFRPDAYPFAVMQASDGALYGTTQGPGRGIGGSVFRLDLDGRFATLHRFDARQGATPQAGLVQGVDGALYGSTLATGANDAGGCLYRIAPGDAFQLLVLLPAQTIRDPSGTLLAGDDGLFYGTAGGGAHGAGCLFGMSPAGELAVACDFPALGLVEPAGGLVFTGDHAALLGVCQAGGTATTGWQPAIFAFDGADLVRLLAPPAGPPGDYTPLTPAPDGATFYGFASVRAGPSTLFALARDGAWRALAQIPGYVAAAPTLAPDGALLGTTTDGGTYGLGSVFRVTGF
jgi:uncharacterized repeat protein (TIGR03803 family)